MKLTRIVRRLRKALLIFITFLLTITASLIRYLFIDPEVAFTLFYLFPIIFVTWKTGIWSGIIISFSSSVLWLLIEFNDPKISSNDLVIYLNNIFRLIIFLIITYSISELKNALEKQKLLARIDPLTSIANRRAFYETADMEIKKAKRYGFPVSFLLMDLDNFKQVNDKYGHNTGDILLKLIADTLLKNIREIDLATRLGGDEFGILLPQANADSAYIVAEKIRRIIAETMEKNSWPVTSSIGIVTSKTGKVTISDMIKNADTLMYSVKYSGKNNIKQAVLSG